MAVQKKNANRRTKKIVGRAATKTKKGRKTPYQGIAKYAPGAGAALGTALGALVGQPAIGGLLGGGAGSLMQHFIGRGDYEVVNNCFLKDGNMCEPIINRSNSGGEIIRKTEFMGDVITSATPNTFRLTSYPVNVGLEQTFQFLSQIACNFEEYTLEGAYIEFRSMSGDSLNSVNSALGTVIMAANYNSGSPNFTNKNQMENYEGGISSKPSSNLRYFMECAKNRNVLENLYVRSGEVPTNQDIRMYDLCNFQIATMGFQGSSVNIGELYITYQVSLRKPKLYAALGSYQNFGYIHSSSFDNTNMIGTSFTYNANNNLLGLHAVSNFISWNAPTLPQAYFISLSWLGGFIGVEYPTLTYDNGLSLATGISNFPPNTTGSFNCCIEMIVKYLPGENINGYPPVIGFTGVPILPTAGTSWRAYILQVPNVYVNI